MIRLGYNNAQVEERWRFQYSYIVEFFYNWDESSAGDPPKCGPLFTSQLQKYQGCMSILNSDFIKDVVVTKKHGLQWTGVFWNCCYKQKAAT